MKSYEKETSAHAFISLKQEWLAFTKWTFLENLKIFFCEAVAKTNTSIESSLMLLKIYLQLKQYAFLTTRAIILSHFLKKCMS